MQAETNAASQISIAAATMGARNLLILASSHGNSMETIYRSDICRASPLLRNLASDAQHEHPWEIWVSCDGALLGDEEWPRFQMTHDRERQALSGWT